MKKPVSYTHLDVYKRQGFVGGGGLGTISINYGFYRYQSDVMLVTVLLLVVIVQVFQEIGWRIATRGDKRSR